jgi:uncharacterized protein YwqG
VAHELPPTGLLLYFYDADQATYGDNPADRAGFHVSYVRENLANLQRQPYPPSLALSSRFTPCAVTYATTLTVAPTPAPEIPGLAWSPDLQKRYEAALSAAGWQQSGTQNQLLGIPNTLQDDMHIECQLASRGISMASAASDPRTSELSPGAANWQLLLQVDSDPQAGMRWADAGMLYYWIERDALRAANFGNVWVVLQSN